MQLKINETVKGYTFFLNHKDYFVVTTHERKTIRLFKAVLKELGLPTTEDNAQFLLSRAYKSECTLRLTDNGLMYYDIKGRNFIMANPLEEDCTKLIFLR